MKSVLPKKASDLIELALNDLEKVQKLKSVRIDMNKWHEPKKKSGVCKMCLAGSVMSKTFKTSRKLDLTPGDLKLKKLISSADYAALSALNDFRAGRVDYGLQCFSLYGDKDKANAAGMSKVVIPEFTGKGTKFKKAMRALVVAMRAIGI